MIRTIDGEAIDVFYDEFLGYYVLTVGKGKTWSPVRLQRSELEQVRDAINEALEARE